MSIKRSGDWALAKRLLANAPRKLKSAVDRSLRQEAHVLRNEIVRGLTKQAPGGKALRPLEKTTLETRKYKGRGGTKALIVSGDLRNGIAAIVKDDEAFIGVPRKTRSSDGRPIIDIAKIQEFGSAPRIIPITPRMAAFLAILLRDAGDETKKGTGKNVVVVTTPPRPFLRPAYKVFSKGAQKRFLQRVAKHSGFGGDS